METSHASEQPNPAPQTSSTLSGGFSAAFHYWEPRRLSYNLLLTVVVLAWVTLTWPHFRPAMNLMDAFRLAVLALLANVCYSTAYIAELFAEPFRASGAWPRMRSVLWVVGTVLAIVFENYWIADEIYPFVR